MHKFEVTTRLNDLRIVQSGALLNVFSVFYLITVWIKMQPNF